MVAQDAQFVFDLGNFCCLIFSIVRAFLIEEQKIVKKVVKAQALEAKKAAAKPKSKKAKTVKK